MSKYIDNDNNIYTNLEDSSVKQKVLLPLRVNRIQDYTILTEEQNRFLGKITFCISCSLGCLAGVTGGDICIESIGVNYNDISVVCPQITMNVNGDDVILNKVNNKYEGKIDTFNECCCNDKDSFTERIITFSGIKTCMNNGVIILKGNISGIHFFAEASYDGFLNGDNYPYSIVNNATLMQSGNVIATSRNTETVIRNSGILNKFNANNFYGSLCLESCQNSWINAYFHNEFCITSIYPTGCYDGGRSFEAYVYGKYKSSLKLYSIAKEELEIYTDGYIKHL